MAPRELADICSQFISGETSWRHLPWASALRLRRAARAMNTHEGTRRKKAVIVFLIEVFSRIRHGVVRGDLQAARSVGVPVRDAVREPARCRRRPDVGGVPGAVSESRSDRRVAAAGVA